MSLLKKEKKNRQYRLKQILSSKYKQVGIIETPESIIFQINLRNKFHQMNLH